jgi:hypothetical protein
MKAITFHGVSDVRATDVADPKVVDPTDVVLRITTSAVCGSDLHQYHGRGGGALVQTGAIMGHEFMGPQLHGTALAPGAGGQAPASADHHPHDGAGRRADGLRDLRPEGGSRDQGDAQALTHDAWRFFFRSSSRMRGSRATTDSPCICSTISPLRSITIVYGAPLKPNELPIVSLGSSATR